MRQGQQHRRGRGRNNNNNNSNHSNTSHNNHRQGQNPLSRSFESNGPEVKVRGTPVHIAEKYLSLARDAQSSGDPVLAENYLQHAEHYNRIIMAYREQQVQQSGEAVNGNGQRIRQGGFQDGEGDEAMEEDGDDPGQSDQPPMQRSQQDQPRFQDQPRSEEGRPHRGQEQPRFRDRQERHERQERSSDRQPPTRARPATVRASRSSRPWKAEDSRARSNSRGGASASVPATSNPISSSAPYAVPVARATAAMPRRSSGVRARAADPQDKTIV